MRTLIACLSMLLAVSVHGPTYAGETHRATQPAFKGYELYSWQVPDGTWRYSLLPGTNRLKTNDEITAAAVAINDVSELKSRLATFAVNEQVFWHLPDAAEFTFPDTIIIEDIKAYCRIVQVSLQVLQ